MIGKTLNHYKIIEPLGAGGMGEVYRAHDTTLKRDVAIKVLPEDLSADVERLGRLEREAQLLAALNHPNIEVIHGLEEADGVRFMVLELIEGESLAEKLSRGRIEVEKVLGIARQIAEALEAAHAKGIIHRDLKPGNVVITPEGQAKVLDFGLAKAHDAETVEPDVSPDITESPTVAAATEAGIILGTAAYMSPEQARGKLLDKRTDIWSFGCVLYEMLTGRKPFEGETVTDVLAAIVAQDPNWIAVPGNVPPLIQVLLRRCLEKDPYRRLHDIGDARIEIVNAISDPAGPLPDVAPRGDVMPLWRQAIPWSLMAVMALVAGTAVWAPWRTSVPDGEETALEVSSRPVRLVVPLPEPAPLALGESAPLGIERPSLALSPDGTHLVYAANIGVTSMLYVRPMDSFDARPIPGTEGAHTPFFSPDGEWVGFFADNEMKKASLSGGRPKSITEATNAYGASWAPDDTIYFSHREGRVVASVSSDGSAPRVISAEGPYFWPEVLPGGKGLLLSGWYASSDPLVVMALDTGAVTTLTVNSRRAQYLPSGNLVYAGIDGIYAVPFDLTRPSIAGSPELVLEGVRPLQFTISQTGMLAYVSGSDIIDIDREFVWVDRQDSREALALDLAFYETFRLSSDGQRLVVRVVAAGTDLWIYDLVRGGRDRLASGGDNVYPVWSPDDQWIVFSSDLTGQYALYRKQADGSGDARLISSVTSTVPLRPYSLSPDGLLIACDIDYDIWIVPVAEGQEPQPFLATPSQEWGPTFSPDGQWIAYVSDENGQYEVYVKSFPPTDERFSISAGVGEEPLWLPGGDEILYRSGNKWMSVRVTTEPEFTAEPPVEVIEGPYLNVGGRSYEASPDGNRLLLLQGPHQPPTTQLNIVLNWFEELKQRVPMEQ